MYKESPKPSAVSPKCEPASVSVQGYAHEIKERAESLAARVNGKLTPVMSPGDLLHTTQSAPNQHKEYPPLFADLYEALDGINSALCWISGCIDRTEL